MRGTLLPLFQPLTTIRGVGPKHADALNRLLGNGRILDLLLLPPRRYDHYPQKNISDCSLDEKVTIKGRVIEHTPPPRPSLPHVILIEDQSGALQITYFRGQRLWLLRTFPDGGEVTLRGSIQAYQGKRQISHPDVISKDAADNVSEWIPCYDLVKGLTQSQLRQWLKTCLSKVDFLQGPEEWHDKTNDGQPLSWKASLRHMHQPTTPEHTDMSGPSWRRLAYDELLSYLLALSVVRQDRRRQTSWRSDIDNKLQKRMISALPFNLTASQTTAIEEVNRDLQTGLRMSRLVLGDVGSGKTIVALAAVASAYEQGYQSALMVPTELLARQHFETASQLLSDILPVHLLTGSTTVRERKRITEQLSSGQALLLIGTQALISETISYARLGMIIIDEQHRFGVEQRMLLSQRGTNPHLILLSATPIPRTMQMVLYRDIDVTTLREKPPGRKPIDTRLLPLRRRQAVVERLKYALQKGQKVYWVCPMVEDEDIVSSGDDVAAVMSRHGELSGALKADGDILAMHGKMKAKEQTATMTAFREAKGAVLVASTVIEVGVDVHDADIIVIDSAERFGLAQLHQLRGRVGRSDRPAYCLLLHKDWLSEIAMQRLKALSDHDDGFTLADIDLKLRGSGDVAGIRQSGFMDMKFYDPYRYPGLLDQAGDDAVKCMNENAFAQLPRGNALRQLMMIYGNDRVLADV